MEQEKAALVRPLEENLQDLWRRFGKGKGCSLHEDAASTWFETPIGQLPYNGVVRFSTEEDVDRRMDAIFARFRERGVPFFWLVHPTAQPADLDRRLRARGFEEAEVLPGMAMPTAALPAVPPVPPGIEIREVLGDSDVAAVLELVAWRWEVPAEVRPQLEAVTHAQPVGVPGSPIRCWVAWKDGVAVSKAILNTAAGAAGLYGVATRPEARGLGLARILTLQAFHAGREAGQDLAVLHSSRMARSLYEKIGFREVAPFRVFAPGGQFHL